MRKLIPAYGRDYKSKKAVEADWFDDKDFILQDITDRYDGKPVNRADAIQAGWKTVCIRYNALRSVCVLQSNPKRKPAKRKPASKAKPNTIGAVLVDHHPAPEGGWDVPKRCVKCDHIIDDPQVEGDERCGYCADVETESELFALADYARSRENKRGILCSTCHTRMPPGVTWCKPCFGPDWS